MKLKELPFGKIPVLTHGDSITIAESTTILRYIANLKRDSIPGHWYSDIPLEKAKIDEFLDHWQSTFNPQILGIIQNTLFYKTMFGMDEPPAKLIQDFHEKFKLSNKLFKSYYLNKGDFIGGQKDPSIADVLAANTYQQLLALIGPDYVKSDADITNYINRVSEKVGSELYEDINKMVNSMGKKK